MTDALQSDYERALDAYDELPDGPETVAAAERAVRAAEGLNDPARVLQARILLAQAHYFVPAQASHLALQAWLIGQLDTDLPSPDERFQILWSAKWAMAGMLDIPDIDLATVEATTDDLAQRFGAEGHSQRVIAQQRMRIAFEKGDLDSARTWYDRWQAAARDTLSDCAACDAHAQARARERLGDDVGALAAARPVISGELSCAEEPHSTLAWSLDALVREGRTTDAIAAHRRGWRLVRDEVKLPVAVAEHLRFLARSGHLAQAVDLLVPRLGWIDEFGVAGEEMTLAGTAGAILLRAEQDGLLTEIDGQPVPQVATALTERAEQIAVSFDRRNGSTVVSSELAAQTALEPYAARILLPSSGAAAPRRSGIIELDEQVRRAAEDRDLVLLELMEDWARRRTELAVETSTDAARARLDRRLAQRVDDPRESAIVWDEAVASAERSGDADLVLLTTIGRAAVSGTPDQAQATELAEDLATRDPASAASALVLLGQREGADPALLDRATALYEQCGLPRQAELVRVGRAQQLATRGDMVPAITFTRAVLERSDDPVVVLEASAVLIGSLMALEGMRGPEDLSADLPSIDIEAVLLRAEEVARAAARPVPFPIALQLAAAAADDDDWDRVAVMASDALDQARRHGIDDVRAEAALLLAASDRTRGDTLGAVEVLEDALAGVDGAGLARGQLSWSVADCYAELGEDRAAAKAFTKAAEIADEHGEPSAAALAWLQAGRAALRTAGDPALVGQARGWLERAAELAELIGEPQLQLDALRARALATSLDDPEQASQRYTATIELARSLGEQGVLPADEVDPLTASLLREHAAVEARQGALDAALGLIGRAEELYRDVSPEGLVAAVSERATYLAEADRLTEAETLLRPILDQLDMVDLEPALASLCRALMRADRQDEADVLWERHLG